jgi:TatD DNase family protein
MMRYFDTHTHLHDKAFDADRSEVLARMREKKVGAITVGTDLATSTQAVALAGEHEDIWAAVGLHPNDNKEESFDEKAFGKLMEHPKIVAIGECGLDYYRGADEDKERQRASFEAQIAFAVAHEKPLMIHCRDAHEDAIVMLADAKKKHGEKVRGPFISLRLVRR